MSFPRRRESRNSNSGFRLGGRNDSKCLSLVIFVLFLAAVTVGPNIGAISARAQAYTRLSWWLVVIVFVLILALVVFRKFARGLKQLETSLGMHVLRVLVPKEQLLDESKKSKSGVEFLREQLGVAEVLWSALGGLKPEGG